VVEYACNPSFLGGGSRRVQVQGHPGQSTMRLYLKIKLKQKNFGHGSHAQSTEFNSRYRKEFKKTIPLTIAPLQKQKERKKERKALDINLTKNIEDVYKENDKALMKQA
jgi:curved DNA-binding protein CbpA